MIRLLKDFGSVQMYQIKLGLKQNIDVSIYAKSEINSGKMARIRQMLEDTSNVYFFSNKIKNKKE